MSKQADLILVVPGQGYAFCLFLVVLVVQLLNHLIFNAKDLLDSAHLRIEVFCEVVYLLVLQ